MRWIGWYSAMALNRITGRCGHFWEERYFSTPIDPSDTRRVLATLRYIHANPKAAGVRKGFHDPYSNYGHYGRLEGDGLIEWHPAFLQLAAPQSGDHQETGLIGGLRRNLHQSRNTGSNSNTYLSAIFADFSPPVDPRPLHRLSPLAR